MSRAVRAAMRGLSTAVCPPGGIIELRDYSIRPEFFVDFVDLSFHFDAARRRAYPGFMGMLSADTGGNVSRIVHLYHFKDFRERDRQRAEASRDTELLQYTAGARKCLAGKESTIMIQPKNVYDAVGMGCASAFTSPAQPPGSADKAVYELRWYKLHAGRNAVQQVMGALKSGIPAKAAADAVGLPVFIGSSDVGLLNQVVEVWRYPSAQHLIDACEQSRRVAAWQEAKASIYPLCQAFSITFLHPVKCSPWQ